MIRSTARNGLTLYASRYTCLYLDHRQAVRNQPPLQVHRQLHHPGSRQQWHGRHRALLLGQRNGWLCHYQMGEQITYLHCYYLWMFSMIVFNSHLFHLLFLANLYSLFLFYLKLILIIRSNFWSTQNVDALAIVGSF